MYICVINEGGTNAEEVDTPETRWREFEMRDFATYETAEAALLTHADASYTYPNDASLVRKDWSITEYDSHPGEWRARVNWEAWIPDLIGDEQLSGSISLQTVKQNYAFNHIGSYSAPGTNAIQSYGALGLKVSSNGTYVIEGRDLEFPLLTFTINKTFIKGHTNIARIIGLNDYVGRPNAVPWRGFGPQTVRLKSADAQNEDDNEDQINFVFEASPTITGIAIQSPFGTIMVPAKLGFQLLSITSVPFAINDGSEEVATVEVPHTAHIDEPSPLCDLNEILP